MSVSEHLTTQNYILYAKFQDDPFSYLVVKTLQTNKLTFVIIILIIRILTRIECSMIQTKQMLYPHLPLISILVCLFLITRDDS